MVYRDEQDAKRLLRDSLQQERDRLSERVCRVQAEKAEVDAALEALAFAEREEARRESLRWRLGGVLPLLCVVAFMLGAGLGLARKAITADPIRWNRMVVPMPEHRCPLGRTIPRLPLSHLHGVGTIDSSRLGEGARPEGDVVPFVSVSFPEAPLGADLKGSLSK